MAGLDEDVLVLDIHDEDYQVTISWWWGRILIWNFNIKYDLNLNH
jgi:hypothetical protein